MKQLCTLALIIGITIGCSKPNKLDKFKDYTVNRFTLGNTTINLSSAKSDSIKEIILSANQKGFGKGVSQINIELIKETDTVIIRTMLDSKTFFIGDEIYETSEPIWETRVMSQKKPNDTLYMQHIEGDTFWQENNPVELLNYLCTSPYDMVMFFSRPSAEWFDTAHISELSKHLNDRSYCARIYLAERNMSTSGGSKVYIEAAYLIKCLKNRYFHGRLESNLEKGTFTE